MTEIEKLILEKLEDMSREIGGIKEEIGGIKEEIGGIKEEIGGIKEEIGGIKEEVGGIKEEISGIKEEVREVKEEVREAKEEAGKAKEAALKTQLTLENEISRKIDIIGEGHDFLKQRLDEALQMEKKREHMELELVNLRMEVKKIKEHLNIA